MQASPIKQKERKERVEGEAYELGKTPSEQAQREADSFQDLIARTQRNFIDITSNSVGAIDAQDVMERQRDVSKFLEESEMPSEASGAAKVPMGSAVAAADPVKVLQQACVTVEEEDALRMAGGAVGRALGSTCVVKDEGKIVEMLPPITADEN